MSRASLTSERRVSKSSASIKLMLSLLTVVGPPSRFGLITFLIWLIYS
jgi:hypothetical protein